MKTKGLRDFFKSKASQVVEKYAPHHEGLQLLHTSPACDWNDPFFHLLYVHDATSQKVTRLPHRFGFVCNDEETLGQHPEVFATRSFCGAGMHGTVVNGVNLSIGHFGEYGFLSKNENTWTIKCLKSRKLSLLHTIWPCMVFCVLLDSTAIADGNGSSHVTAKKTSATMIENDPLTANSFQSNTTSHKIFLAGCQLYYNSSMTTTMTTAKSKKTKMTSRKWFSKWKNQAEYFWWYHDENDLLQSLNVGKFKLSNPKSWILNNRLNQCRIDAKNQNPTPWILTPKSNEHQVCIYEVSDIGTDSARSRTALQLDNELLEVTLVQICPTKHCLILKEKEKNVDPSFSSFFRHVEHKALFREHFMNFPLFWRKHGGTCVPRSFPWHFNQQRKNLRTSSKHWRATSVISLLWMFHNIHSS